jgi:tetratricopeptide (TPR) repeat protein
MQLSRALILLLTGVASLPAQQRGIQTPGNAPSPTLGNGSIGNNTPASPVPPQGEPPLSTRPIFLSGRVAMDDGSPAPNSISIQRVCLGNPHTVAYTDSRGRFNFQWGDTSGIVPDASESGATIGPGGRIQSTSPSMGRINERMGTPTMGCELRANAAGYRSDRVDISDQRFLDRGDIGTIVLHRLAEVEGRSISATSLAAPKDAAKAYDKGLQALTKNKPSDAQKDFEKAVDLYPKYASAWYDLGRARDAQQNSAGAREAYLKAMEADDKLVGPWVELGQMAANQKNWDDASKYLDRALKLDPIDFPQLWFMDAVANYNTMHYDAAEHGAREALQADPQHKNPRVFQLLGLILAQKGDSASAAEALHNYLTLAPDAPDAEQTKQQLAALESKSEAK